MSRKLKKLVREANRIKGLHDIGKTILNAVGNSGITARFIAKNILQLKKEHKSICNVIKEIKNKCLDGERE